MDKKRDENKMNLLVTK